MVHKHGIGYIPALILIYVVLVKLLLGVIQLPVLFNFENSFDADFRNRLGGSLSIGYVCTRVCCVQRVTTCFSQANKTTTGMLAQQINPVIFIRFHQGNHM